MLERNTQQPIPDDIQLYLTAEQVLMVERMADFGWDLWFIRRPAFQDSICMIHRNPDNENAVIEPDGTINYNHEVIIRT